MDYYDILQVDYNATKEEILTAYQTLFRKYQDEADLKGGYTDEISEKVNKIKTAYETLSDDMRRSAYDDPQDNADGQYADTEEYAPKSKTKSLATALFFGLLPYIVIGIAICIYFIVSSHDPLKGKEVAMPMTGIIAKNISSENVAPLEIIIPKEETKSYYIKLINIKTDNTAMTMFIRKGESLDILVPLGSYELRYACGENWYGEEYLFGKNTEYYKTDDTFDFTEDKEGYNGWTVDLTGQIDGNLETPEIDDDDF